MKATLIVTLIAITAILGCDGSSNPQSTAAWSPFTIMDNEEGALAALWLSGELTAPPQLYRTIVSNLAAIRTAYADSTTMTSIKFFPPWVPSMVDVRLTDTGVTRLRDGRFKEFDELGVRFGLTRIDTSTSLWKNYRYAFLYFSGDKHPQRLADAYNALADVANAEPNGYVGDWDCLYPWRIDGGISYLIRYGWGDCPAGCINNVFWYFRVINGEIEYVGRYHKWVDDEPDWWDEADDAFNAYKNPER